MKCKYCNYSKQIGRQNANIWQPSGGRALFFCHHPKAPSHAFIDYSTLQQLNVPAIKTRKRWFL